MSWANTLWGVALGDAWGAPGEFAPYHELTAKGRRGPDFPSPARVTDDTQMTLAVAQALADTRGWALVGRQVALVEAMNAWLDDEDNTADRAPGGTCLSACERLAQGVPWQAATVLDSKGCGTVMRTAPLAFVDESHWRELTAYTSLLTHAHPTATTAALVLTATMRALSQAPVPTRALDVARQLCTSDTLFDGLDALVGQVSPDPGVYFDQGRGEVHAALDLAAEAVRELRGDPWSQDLCALAGQGWVAEECLGVALAAVELFADDPLEALRRAAVVGGDSDSIAAVAGGVLGVAHPGLVWPKAWTSKVEPRYARWIMDLSG